MKKILTVSCALLLFMLFSSCEKGSYNNLSSITFGTSFGECNGYCSKEMVIVGQQVTFSTHKNGPVPATKTCSKTISEEELNTIKTLIERSKIKILPEVIGCPDCADGGAAWIEIISNGKKYKVTYDYGTSTPQLKALTVKLEELAKTFNSCN